MNTAAPPPVGDHPRRARDIAGLEQLRWAVRAVLIFGVAASIAANVLHARPNLISQLIAAWPPMALLLTVELISRVPADRRRLAAARLISAAIIAGIAAWVSYWHMVGVAARYGETSAHANYLLPLSVDGLVVVASISLVEIAGRINRSQAGTQDPDPVLAAATTVTETPLPRAGSLALSLSTTANTVLGNVAQPVTAAGGSEGHRAAGESAAANRATPAVRNPYSPQSPSENRTEHRQTPERADVRDATKEAGQAAVSAPAGLQEPASDEPKPDSETAPTHNGHGKPAAAVKQTRRTDPPDHTYSRDARNKAGSDAGPVDDDDHDHEVPSGTAAAVAYWYRRHPQMHPAEIADRIGRSERTVRRHWPPRPTLANGESRPIPAEQHLGLEQGGQIAHS